MALQWEDLVHETTTSTGTGTVNLAGAATGYRGFVEAGLGGATVAYLIRHTTLNEWEEGIGTVTDASPDTLSRTTVLRSSNSNSPVTFSSGTKDVVCVNLGEMIIERPDLCNGRLTLESGVAISTSDQTAKTTLYWTPYNGNKVTLWTGAIWKSFTFSELSIAIPSQVFRIYDVFVYNNAGTLALELIAWDSGGQTTGSITGATNATPVVLTSASHGRSVGDLIGVNSVGGNTAPNGKIWYLSNTTTTLTLEGSVGNGAYTSGGTWYLIPVARTTAISLQDGVYVKTSDKTRRYLGTFMTTDTAGQSEDSMKRRFVWNNYNRVQRPMECFDTTDSWTYSTAAFRPANANTDVGTGQLLCVVGLSGDAIAAYNFSGGGSSGADSNVAAGIGLKRCAANSARLLGNVMLNGTRAAPTGRYNGQLPIGFNFLQRLEYATGATTTWYGDVGVTYWQTGMQAEVFC